MVNCTDPTVSIGTTFTYKLMQQNKIVDLLVDEVCIMLRNLIGLESNVILKSSTLVITHAKERICFYQHWFVCLSVSNIIKKVNGF